MKNSNNVALIIKYIWYTLLKEWIRKITNHWWCTRICITISWLIAWKRHIVCIWKIGAFVKRWWIVFHFIQFLEMKWNKIIIIHNIMINYLLNSKWFFFFLNIKQECNSSLGIRNNNNNNENTYCFERFQKELTQVGQIYL